MVAIKISRCCTGRFCAVGLEERKHLWKQEATPWTRSTVQTPEVNRVT